MCDSHYCYGTKSANYYSKIIPDFSLKISGKKAYTLPGYTLMDETARNSTYGCKFAIYNSKWHFVLGEYFIKNFYTIYDLENDKLGIAPLKDYTYHTNKAHEDAAGPPEATRTANGTVIATPDEGDKDGNSGTAMVVLFMIVLFIVSCGVGAFCLHKRRLR